MAAKNAPKKEALKDKGEHAMAAHFGPELAKKVRKERSGTGNCCLEGQPKSDVAEDDELELEVLACTSDVASPWDLLATHRCGRSFTWQQQRI
jgi:hypothetical protein